MKKDSLFEFDDDDEEREDVAFWNGCVFLCGDDYDLEKLLNR